MLAEYASLGNALFEVQERATKLGSEWHVIPVKARNKDGQFVRQTALLDNVITISKQKRTYDAMFDEICGQLSVLSGHEIMLGVIPLNTFYALQNYQHEWEATNQPARDVLADLLGPGMAWRLLFDPGKNLYVLNIHTRYGPPAPPPLAPGERFVPFDKPGRLSDPAHRVSRDEAYPHLPTAVLRHYPLSHERISEVQSALARAGYYRGDPTGTWDTNTIEAMKKFQSANGLPPSGRWDEPSLRKLGVTFSPSVPANIPKPQE